MLHIVFSYSAEKMVRHALKGKEGPFAGDVLSYEPQLQLGDLQDDRKRFRKWVDVYQVPGSDEEMAMFIKALRQAEQNVIEALRKEKEAIFWVGETAGDELAFLRLTTLLEEEIALLMLKRMRGRLSAKDLEDVEPVVLTEETLGQYREKWQEISKQGDRLRIRRGNFAYDFVEDSVYDEQLLALLPDEEPVRLVVVAGELYSKAPHLPYYFFIWRIDCLKKTGIIGVEGEEKGIKTMSIKRLK
ncbi:DUF1835 domain-containing protein [Halalkalibacter oceani]|uniref:DUF1835 domain-containing protein n=1 Tax=Halalkalibacter oceani TaxID=1653776 RepID=UPI003397EBE9